MNKKNYLGYEKIVAGVTHAPSYIGPCTLKSWKCQLCLYNAMIWSTTCHLEHTVKVTNWQLSKACIPWLEYSGISVSVHIIILPILSKHFSQNRDCKPRCGARGNSRGAPASLTCTFLKPWGEFQQVDISFWTKLTDWQSDTATPLKCGLNPAHLSTEL